MRDRNHVLFVKKHSTNKPYGVVYLASGFAAAEERRVWTRDLEQAAVFDLRLLVELLDFVRGRKQHSVCFWNGANFVTLCERRMLG